MLVPYLPDLSKHDLKQVPEGGYVTDKLRVAGVMKNKLRAQRGVLF